MTHNTHISYPSAASIISNEAMNPEVRQLGMTAVVRFPVISRYDNDGETVDIAISQPQLIELKNTIEEYLNLCGSPLDTNLNT